MEWFKRNKKTVLSFILIAIVFFVVRNFGGEASENETSGIASANATGQNELEQAAESPQEPELEEQAAESPQDQEDAVLTEPTDETDEGDTENTEKTVEIIYKFRNDSLWEEHFKKHGKEFPYETKEEYLEGANIMLSNPDKLHKNEKEDGDDVYYLEATNEFIIVSGDGYLRTYFKPDRGKAYFDKQ